MHYSKIDTYLSGLNNKIHEYSYEIKDIRTIQYAKKITFQKNGEKGVVVIYWSQKKGFSFVCEGNFSFKDEILLLLSGKVPVKSKSNFNFKNGYIGMDESGKGDYFGPLVLCGFILNDNVKNVLDELGVADSKKLTHKKNLQIYEILKKDLRNFYKVKIIMPDEYNESIETFSKQNKKLNHLLGQAYSWLIRDFNDKKSVYLIDKFSDERFIKEFLGNDYNLVLKERAETYTGVAAASIIARSVFLENMLELSQEAGLELPLGAGKKCDETAKNLLEKIGEKGLKKYVKWHFKNTKKVKGDLN